MTRSEGKKSKNQQDCKYFDLSSVHRDSVQIVTIPHDLNGFKRLEVMEEVRNKPKKLVSCTYIPT